MNRALAIAEWRRAKACLRAAASCFRRRCYADAISRAYYAVFHAARAALRRHSATFGQRHGHTRLQFGKHLVNTGLVERYYGREIGSLYELRLKADYDITEQFSEVFARSVRQRAERFLVRVLRPADSCNCARGVGLNPLR